MKCLLRVLMFGLIVLPAGTASAQWYVRGDFDWSNNVPMTDHGGGHYSYLVTGLSPNQYMEFKVTVGDWTENYPGGNNARTHANSAGEIEFHFWQGAQGDGWEPAGYSRVGYADHQQYEWELMGTVNDPVWSGGPAYYLTDMSNGLHRVEVPLDAGSYAFKFRKQGDWNINIGENFGDNAADATTTITTPGVYAFELDLPGGRWRVSQVVPEPAAVTLVGLAMLGLVGIGRRRR